MMDGEDRVEVGCSMEWRKKMDDVGPWVWVWVVDGMSDDLIGSAMVHEQIYIQKIKAKAK